MSLNMVEFKKMREIFAETPEESIDMGTFGRKNPRCGTTCCLAGWYLIAGEAKDEKGLIGRWEEVERGRPDWFRVVFSSDRLMAVLGIDTIQYDYLFIDSANLDKEGVLQRLDGFIASGEEVPEYDDE